MVITWELIKTVIYWIIVINAIGAVFTVFREKRDIAATWAWLLVLVLVPVVGFIAYAFLGRKLPHKRLDLIQAQTELQINEALEAQKREIGSMTTYADQITKTAKGMVTLFQNSDNAFLTRKN